MASPSSDKILKTVSGAAGSAARLPLRIAGKAVGAVASHLPDRTPAAPPQPPPTDVPEEPAAQAPAKKAAVKKAPATKAPAKKAAAKKTPAKKTTAKKAAPVTKIDAAAAREDVSVTPADVAGSMGTDLDDRSPSQ